MTGLIIVEQDVDYLCEANKSFNVAVNNVVIKSSWILTN